MPKKKPWTEDEMRAATLIHGPDSTKADTYRLHLPSDTEDVPGKYLDVPGWMVGDAEMVATRVCAASIIRERLTGKKEGR